MDRDDDTPRTRGRPEKPPLPPKAGTDRLGNELRQLRRSQNLTLRGMAELIGYSAGHLSEVEQGKATPSPEFVTACERVLGADGSLRSYYQLVLSDQEATRGRLRGASQVGQRPGPPAVGQTTPGDRSEFVADVSLEDGQVVSPGEVLIKRWRLRNAGAVPWIGRQLERVGPPAGVGLITSPKRVPISDTQPGELVDIEIELRAPDLDGSTVAHFRSIHPDGTLCFPDRYAQGIYVRLTVRS